MTGFSTDFPSRCPHLLVPSFLGHEGSGALLDFAMAHEHRFTPAVVYRPRTASQEVAPSRRNCLYLSDLSGLRPSVEQAFRALAPTALDALGIEERLGSTMELEMCAYRDGAYFRDHTDVYPDREPARILSFVYYFTRQPRRFEGGELRLFAWESGQSEAPATIEVAPENDLLTVFPSWLEHEVLPVRGRTDAWADQRFSINGWFHRAARAEAGPPVHGTTTEPPSLGSRIQWSGRHVAARVDGNLLLTHLRTGIRCELPPHQAEIWRALEYPITAGRIVDLLSERADEAARSDIARYVLNFLELLREQDLVSIEPQGR